jgi:hypothetical protein
MVAMLIGCGLRRAELLALQLESIQQREEQIADLVGKGGHVRTVPIPTRPKLPELFRIMFVSKGNSCIGESYRPVTPALQETSPDKRRSVYECHVLGGRSHFRLPTASIPYTDATRPDDVHHVFFISYHHSDNAFRAHMLGLRSQRHTHLDRSARCLDPMFLRSLGADIRRPD